MPTIIKLIPDKDSQNKLRDYLKSQNVKNAKERFHSTLHYSLNPLFKINGIEDKIKQHLPFEILPPYISDVFGSSLVLKYYNSKRDSLKREVDAEHAKQIIKGWPEGLNEEEIKILKTSDFILEEVLQDTGLAYLTQQGIYKRIYFASFPHITLAKDFTKQNLKYLNKFEEKLIFNGFVWKQKES